jgi:hypothetical protein
MRSFGSDFMEANNQLDRSPRLAAKITNSTGAFWLVSHSDVETLGEQYTGIMEQGLTGQTIEPEKSISVLGSMAIETVDNGFTEKMRAILTQNETIIGDKVEVWIGYQEMDFADYQLLATYWVDGVDNDFKSYTLRLIDTQRFIKRSIFSKKSTQLFKSIKSTETFNTIEVLSTEGFELVAHDGDWADAPNLSVGYLKINGVDSAGTDVFEVLRYTGKTATTFTGVSRGVLGTKRVTGKGTEDGDGAVSQVEEFIYLDLNIPKMAMAIMTGDLYGQAGGRLPAHWHCGLTADKIDLLSFEEIGADLWSVPLSFMNPKVIDGKMFLATQVMRPVNLFLKVDQYGELSLRRFAAIYQKSIPDGFLDQTNTIEFSGVKREAKGLKNRFEILWEWRHEHEKHARRSIFIDQDSIERNNFTSEILTIKLDGVRNRSKDIQHTLEQFAEGIRARYSNPAINATAKVFLSDAVQYEVGDLVLVSLPYPDFADTDTLETTMEVQGVSIDFVRGTAELKLLGSSGQPTAIDFDHGADPTELDHTGWTELVGALTAGGLVNGTGFAVVGNTLELMQDFTLTGGPTTASGRYWYDGNIKILTGITLTTTLNTTIDCTDLTLAGTASITSKGNGLAGGSGMIAAKNDWTGVRGSRGFYGGADSAMEGIDRIWGFFSTKMSRDAYRPSSANVSAAYNSVKTIILSINDSNQIVGLPTTLCGSSGSGGARGRFITNATGSKIYYAGGAGGSSGGGIVIVCDNVFADASATIITDGNDGSLGTAGSQFWAGSGGGGYAGGLVVLIKKKTSPMPSIFSNVSMKSGNVPVGGILAGGADGVSQMADHGAWLIRDYTWTPYRTSAQKNASNADCSAALYVARRLMKPSAAVQVLGANSDGNCSAPVALSLVYTPDERNDSHGYITATATPPNDPDYSYTKFWYTRSADAATVGYEPTTLTPCDHDLNEENSFRVPVSVSGVNNYYVLARSVSKNGAVETTGISSVLVVGLAEKFLISTTPRMDISDRTVTYAQSLSSVIEILCNDGGNSFVKQFEIEYKRSFDSTYKSLGAQTNKFFSIVNAGVNITYNIRARSISFDGQKSNWRDRNYQVVGQITSPDDVVGLSATVLGNQIFLSWDAVSNPDLSHYRVRYSSRTIDASYSNAQDLIEKVARPAVSCFVPAMTGTYFVTAVDKLGQRSLAPASVIIKTDISTSNQMNLITTISEAPAFAGTLEDLAIVDGSLQLTSSTIFDEAAGVFDAGSGLFDAGAGSIAPLGYYYFANSFDLGAVFTSRISSDIDIERIDYVDSFDSAQGLFDYHAGYVDGDSDNFDDTTVTVEMRTTLDDPLVAPVWSPWQQIIIGDATARAFEWRAVMQSKDVLATGTISTLDVIIDMPDSDQAGGNIVTPVGPQVVVFERPFKEIRAIGITTHFAQSGDYFNITNKTNAGFTIEFYNAAATVVSRTFDYIAKGIGRGS